MITHSPIQKREELENYLQVALQLEHATIPPYLTAAYSAQIEANKSAIDIIRTVAKEEMLHFTLAANLLNAIGESPKLLRHGFVPSYPTKLPAGPDQFQVNIEKFSDDAVHTFLDIERPAPANPAHEHLITRVGGKVEVGAAHLDKGILADGRAFTPATPTAAPGGSEVEVHREIGPLEPDNLSAHTEIARQQAVAATNEVQKATPDAAAPAAPTYDLQYDIALIAGDKLDPQDREARKKSMLPVVMMQDERGEPIDYHYASIGDFYAAIELGFTLLTRDLGEKELFCGHPGNQIDVQAYYSAGGECTTVTDLRSAREAIDLIAGQGEGNNKRIYDKEGELAHYYRFDQILKRRYYRLESDDRGDEPDHPQGGQFPVDMTAVYPIKKNAKLADYAGFPEIEAHAVAFNQQYRRLLERLNEAFNGHPELLNEVFAAEMFGIKKAMERLMRNPIPGTNENAAPTFEI